MLKKKIWANFLRIIELFTQKNCHQALKNMGLGSEIRDPEKPIPDPRSRGQKGAGSRIRIRNTGGEYMFHFNVSMINVRRIPNRLGSLQPPISISNWSTAPTYSKFLCGLIYRKLSFTMNYGKDLKKNVNVSNLTYLSVDQAELRFYMIKPYLKALECGVENTNMVLLHNGGFCNGCITNPWLHNSTRAAYNDKSSTGKLSYDYLPFSEIILVR